MCENGNHQGFIADTSVTRRTLLLTIGAVAAASGMPAFAEDPGARTVTEKTSAFGLPMERLMQHSSTRADRASSRQS